MSPIMPNRSSIVKNYFLSAQARIYSPNRRVDDTNKPIAYKKPAVGKAMTIGIGLSCNDGIVLAADTQLTVEGFFKDSETKIREIGFDKQGAVILTYAGLPSLTSIVFQEINKRIFYAGKDPAWTDIEQTIGEILSEVRERHPREMEDNVQQFLFAISTPHLGPTLFKAHLDVVSPEFSAAIGVGDSSLVRYLIRKFWKQKMCITHALLLAVYIVNQAKEYVDKVGGKTEACILQANGHVVRFNGPYIDGLDNCIIQCEEFTLDLLSEWAERGMGQAGFDWLLRSYGRRMKELRPILYGSEWADGEKK